ncbi:MAG: nicotinamide mononucleotide transporter family protein [Pirellula sp.]|nr:nicotinamide mononucleotide transporter family protein [Pirellula sp.]
MSLIEIVAAIFGFLSVWFYIVRNPASWPTGLVQVLLLWNVFWNAKLYADFGLHVLYAVLQIYGWWIIQIHAYNKKPIHFFARLGLVKQPAFYIHQTRLMLCAIGIWHATDA